MEEEKIKGINSPLLFLEGGAAHNVAFTQVPTTEKGGEMFLIDKYV